MWFVWRAVRLLILSALVVLTVAAAAVLMLVLGLFVVGVASRRRMRAA